VPEAHAELLALAAGPPCADGCPVGGDPRALLADLEALRPEAERETTDPRMRGHVAPGAAVPGGGRGLAASELLDPSLRWDDVAAGGTGGYGSAGSSSGGRLSPYVERWPGAPPALDVMGGWGAAACAGSGVDQHGGLHNLSGSGRSPSPDGSSPNLLSPRVEAELALGRVRRVAEAVGSGSTPLPFTLEQLTVLRAAAREGSFAAAAEASGLSRPRVSQAIADLEATLGLPLFHRRHRSNPVLTAEGAVLAARAERIARLCAEMTSALGDAQGLAAGAGGCVFLGASQTTGTYLMPRLLGIFRSRHPGCAVRLTVDTSSRVCEAVARGDLDAAVVGGEVPTRLLSSLSVSAYSEDEMVLVVPRGHPLAGRDGAGDGGIEPSELIHHDFVALHDASSVHVAQGKLLKKACGLAWTDLRVVVHLNSVDALKSAVQYGLGVAFLSSLAVSKEVDLGLLCRVRLRGLRMARKLHLVTYRGGYHTRAARVFLQEMFNVALGLPEGRDADVAGTPMMRHLSARPWELPGAGGGAGSGKGGGGGGGGSRDAAGK